MSIEKDAARITVEAYGRKAVHEFPDDVDTWEWYDHFHQALDAAVGLPLDVKERVPQEGWQE